MRPHPQHLGPPGALRQFLNTAHHLVSDHPSEFLCGGLIRTHLFIMYIYIFYLYDR